MGKKKRKTFSHEDFLKNLKIAEEKKGYEENELVEDTKVNTVNVPEEKEVEKMKQLEILEKIYTDDVTHDTERIKKGYVFFIKRNIDDNNIFKDTSVVTKDNRPFVVLSNCVNNRNSRVITMAPIVTHEAKGPYSVEFTDSNLVRRCIDINQLTVVPISHIGGYAYRLSQEVMDRADKALIIHLSLKRYVVKLVSQYVEEITGVKLPRELDIDLNLKEDKPLSIEEVKALVNRRPIQNSIEVSVENKKEDTDISAEVFAERNVRQAKEKQTTKKEDVKKNNGTKFNKHVKNEIWTKSEAKSYIEFYNTHTIEECETAFEMKKGSIYSLVYTLRKRYKL